MMGVVDGGYLKLGCSGSYSGLSYFQDHLLKEGLAWLDSQAPGEAQYWLPALFSELTSRDVSPEEANQMTP